MASPWPWNRSSWPWVSGTAAPLERGTVTAGHLSPTLVEPDPSQSRGDMWILDLSLSDPVVSKGPPALASVLCPTSAYSHPLRCLLTCASLVPHHGRHRNDCSLGRLPPSERGPHLRALICVSLTKASDEVYTGRPTLGPPGVSRVYAQVPAFGLCQRLRRPSESLAPWTLGGGLVVGWFPWAVRRGTSRWDIWEGALRCTRRPGMGTASEPSTWASNLPVTQLVILARGAFPRSTPCVCALWGFLPGRVLPDRTTRRHGRALLPPNWVGLAGRVVTITQHPETACSCNGPPRAFFTARTRTCLDPA